MPSNRGALVPAPDDLVDAWKASVGSGGTIPLPRGVVITSFPPFVFVREAPKAPDDPEVEAEPSAISASNAPEDSSLAALEDLRAETLRAAKAAGEEPPASGVLEVDAVTNFVRGRLPGPEGAVEGEGEVEEAAPAPAPKAKASAAKAKTTAKAK